MEESILKMHDKTTLKNLALDKGLTRRGFNGRNASKMRKQDFIDFILKDQILPSDSSELLEDDMINIFQELIMDDSFQPIIHIMGALSGFVDGSGIHVFSRSTSTNGQIKKDPERIPNEEDESVPTLIVQELVQKCTSECNCEVCRKNIDITEKNLKVKESLHNLETKITCVVCLCNARNVIFGPCNHLASCISCSKNPLLKKCPLCRKPFDSTIRVFC
jgi:hypothetical protein